MTNRDIALVVVAAGQGQRLGAGKPKAFVDLVGRPLLTHAIESIIALPKLAQLIIAVPESHLIEAAQIGAELIGELPIAFDVVLGGETRQGSISNALAELHAESKIVLVHDAARALAPTSLFETVADSVRKSQISSLPVMRVVDTIKRIDGDTVLETVDREVLRSAQTPQGFVATELVAAYAAAEADFTDDAALMQAIDAHRPALVLLHSAEAARHFGGECDRLGIDRAGVHLAALGDRIAAAAGPGWAGCAIADRPDDAALLATALNLCQNTLNHQG